MKAPLLFLASLLLVAPVWGQESGSQSIKDKLRSTLPP